MLSECFGCLRSRPGCTSGLCPFCWGSLERSCAGKARHGGAPAARAARSVTVASSPDPDNLRVYECPMCGCWHVGHADQVRLVELEVLRRVVVNLMTPGRRQEIARQWQEQALANA